MQYYVKQNAAGIQDGTAEHPFGCISQAAAVALAGDTVIIGEGTYREWVNPANGGFDDATRITYKAAENEKPVISGAELVQNWVKVGDSLWSASVSNKIFGEYNPYSDIVSGDWYDPLGQVHHTGEVFANGVALYEAPALEEIDQRSKHAQRINSWYAEVGDEETVFWVFMPTQSPAECVMEVTARPYGFFPSQEGRNFITLSGITVCMVATQWAPPTAFQSGAVGAHWSRGWIIENCTVYGSKCVGISLGKRHDSDDNIWTSNPIKGGAQTYTEIIFKNLDRDWNKDTIGSHIIRQNTIYNCGQAGIVGCMGGAFSLIENNHIFNINNRNEFDGAEMAGIKLHAPIDTVLRDNRIHDCIIGIWLDWQAQGTRVSRNIMFNNGRDLIVEVCHGPAVIDNNLLLSKVSLFNVSQGISYVHNLFAGSTVLVREPRRFTMYHLPHSTSVLGSIVVHGGDDRVYNNVFVGKVDQTDCGTAGYNKYHDKDHLPNTANADVQILLNEDNTTLGIFVNYNAYFGTAGIYQTEENSFDMRTSSANVDIERSVNGYDITIELPSELFDQNCPEITTERLGYSFQSGAAYENPDASPLTVDTDMFGNKRDRIVPGPLSEQITHICITNR